MLDRHGVSHRFHAAPSEWARSFDLRNVKCLVVCRGPVRKEACEVFDEMGIREYGILLSEKDSVVYPRCLAPELRSLRFPKNVHRVPDYMGVGQEGKLERIAQIVGIAKRHGYTHVFAGYGFMAEDAEFIEAIERAGLSFVGPSSSVVRRAGAKDEAKKLARSLGNAVIPGIDDISARALARKVGDIAGLERCATEHGLKFAIDSALPLEENAERVLQAGYAATVELVTIPELQKAADQLCAEIWDEYPGKRIRFKHIGGGGGKGQRVVAVPEDIPSAVMDILAESKVVEPGSNRNFLIELNLETTRHNEIQLVGNGDWTISLGGRDCSVQMHEQKLVEVSLTKELLEREVARASGVTLETLRADQGALQRMETEGERFGEAVGLDSVSTFECIVEGADHFFMEMNTRIQVEHGVTELAYRLRFTNPGDPDDFFEVERLIECMVLLAVHGSRLPRPDRVIGAPSGVEVRINASNAALQPHAGGLIRSWTPPIEGEIRDEQGICTRNPDTGAFVYYHLAGAYDSNVALLLTAGESRGDNLERMAEVLRRMELRGEDLQTNQPMHYGLISWMIGRNPLVKPSTRFMTSYLGAVGAVQEVACDVDVEFAAEQIERALPDAEARDIYALKQTLLLRPLQQLLDDPHHLAGFIGLHDGRFWVRDGEDVRFHANPIRFLDALYHYLDLDDSPEKAPCDKIWSHDLEILEAGLSFYREVAARSGVSADDWAATQALFDGARDPRLADGDAAWEACLAAHRGFQLGMELLLLIPRIGIRSRFVEICVGEDLVPVFPDVFHDDAQLRESTKALAPPPAASSDEIVTPMGGTFYAREAPHLPPLIQPGERFEAGQPLFVIEVMKMFNKVLAPFSGIVTENLMEGADGTVVAKGQTILKIVPDERVEIETPEQIRERMRSVTRALL